MSGLICRLLGPFEVEVAGELVDFGGRKPRLLFAILLLERGRAVSCDRLLDELWSHSPPRTARHLVHVHVSSIRSALTRPGAAAGAVATVRGGYVLRLDGVTVDGFEFERLVDAAVGSLAGDPGQAASLLREALAQWRGSALADFAYEPFAQAEIARLEELRLLGRETLINARLALGEHRELVSEIRGLVTEHPYREQLRAQLMLALYRSGRQADALEAYTAARTALVSDLGVEPSLDLRNLHRRILVQDASLAIEPAAVRTTGTKRSRRQLVTVVAARVPSPLLDHLDPEARRTAIDAALERAKATLERSGATLQPSDLDSLVGAFGVPAAREDDPLRGASAAVETAASMTPGVPGGVRLAVGVETGEVVTEGAVIRGQPISTAIRLSESAGPGEALLGDTAFGLVRHAVTVRDAEDGMRRLTAVLPGTSALVRRWGVPFLGRRAELAKLHRWLDETRSNRAPRLITIVGEAGVGKSRLARQFTADLDPPGFVGRCVSHGDDTALAPIRDIVEGVAGAVHADAIARRLHTSEHRRRDAELIAAALNGRDPAGRRDDLFLALRRLIDATATRPRVVVFDDVQWAQTACLELIALLAAPRRRAPLLVLCLARPEFVDQRAEWLTATRAAQLVLEPLTEAESGELAASLATDVAMPRNLTAQIVQTASGNPFFLEQLYAIVTDERQPPSSVALPLTIRQLLSARLDRLGPAERAVLEVAAVAGREFDLDIIAALLPPEARPGLSAHLRQLRHMRFLQARAGRDEASFRFEHDLTRETVYTSIPKSVRATLHKQIADRYVELHGAELGDRDELVGHHLEQAWLCTSDLHPEASTARTLAERAAHHLWSAGRRSVRLNDLATADALYSRVATLLPDEPTGQLLEEHACVLVRDFRDYRRADAYLAESIRRASASGNSVIALRARHGRLNVLVFSSPDGVPDHLEREARELLAAFQDADDDLGISRAWQTIGFCHGLRSRYAEAMPFLMHALRHARRSGDQLEEADIFCDLVDALYGGPTPSSQAIARCDRILVEAPSAMNQLWTLSALAPLYAMTGHPELARDMIVRTNHMLDELADIVQPYFVTMVRLRQYAAGQLLADETLIDETVRLMPDDHLINHPMHQVAVAAARAQRRADERSWQQILTLTDPARDSTRRWTVAHVERRLIRANALTALNRPDEAVATAREAVALATRTDALNIHAHALMTLARLEADANHPTTASSCIEAALVLWEAKENRPMASRAHALLDDVSRRKAG